MFLQWSNLYQAGQEEDPRQEADERIYGLGSGRQEATRGSVSQLAQRRTQQDARKIVEVIFFTKNLKVPAAAVILFN